MFACLHACMCMFEIKCKEKPGCVKFLGFTSGNFTKELTFVLQRNTVNQTQAERRMSQAQSSNLEVVLAAVAVSTTLTKTLCGHPLLR